MSDQNKIASASPFSFVQVSQMISKSQVQLLVYLPKHCTFCTQHIYLHKKFIGSSIVEPYLIFVTCTTCGSCEEQICHVERLQISTHDILKWRNFKFPHMIDVKKSEFCPRVKKFQISPHDRCGEILNLSCFVAKSVL